MNKKHILTKSAILCLCISNIYFLIASKNTEQKIKALEEKKIILEKEIASQLNLIGRFRIETKVSQLRKLYFLRPPAYDEIEREKIRSYLLDELKKELPDEKLEINRWMLVKFGFIDPGFDLKEGLLTVYSEQIGAFYDVEKKKLFSVKGLSLGVGLQNAVLAHELTHVLQDQHFDIKTLLKSKTENDDQQLAIQALVEGDATFMTQLYYLHSLNWSFLWDLISSLFIDQKEFKKSPYVIQQNLLFPYLKGLEFVTELYKKSEWKLINLCFKKPPESTEHILHSEKYILGNDPPKKLILPDFAKVLPHYTVLSENILGEFNIRLLLKIILKNHTSMKYSEGWGGDRYALLKEKNGEKMILVWLSSWDSLEDAKEFEEASQMMVIDKFPEIVMSESRDAKTVGNDKDVWVLVERKDDKVLYIETSQKSELDEIRSEIRSLF